jgi:CBS domain-containing protein
MRGRTIGCVPVVEGTRLVGIVTVSDLMRLLERAIKRPAKPSRPAVGEYTANIRCHRHCYCHDVAVLRLGPDNLVGAE